MSTELYTTTRRTICPPAVRASETTGEIASSGCRRAALSAALPAALAVLRPLTPLTAWIPAAALAPSSRSSRPDGFSAGLDGTSAGPDGISRRQMTPSSSGGSSRHSRTWREQGRVRLRMGMEMRLRMGVKRRMGGKGEAEDEGEREGERTERRLKALEMTRGERDERALSGVVLRGDLPSEVGASSVQSPTGVARFVEPVGGCRRSGAGRVGEVGLGGRSGSGLLGSAHRS